MSVFVGTTNRDDWLNDETGARRFWPVETGIIRIDIARENREQYFAEAMSLLSGGSTWWEIPAAEAQAQQKMREQGDVWDDPVAFAVKGLASVTAGKVLCDIGIETGRQTRADQMRVGACLRRMGWKRERVRFEDRVSWAWIRSVKPENADHASADQSLFVELISGEENGLSV
jgi:predicted P-loop ATPase